MSDKDVIPPHHSPLRHMMAETKGQAYEPLRNLQEAQAADDAVVIMEGDWGGQIYLVCPVRLVHCSEEALQKLLAELDKAAWECNDGEGTGLYYEHRRLGEGIAGGMGGGLATSDLWIHTELAALGLEERIRQVVGGVLDIS